MELYQASSIAASISAGPRPTSLTIFTRVCMIVMPELHCRQFPPKAWADG